MRVTEKNVDLRIQIVEMIRRAGEGHIPSSFSIIDILNVLYGSVLRFDPDLPDWPERDLFVLSKGHGAAALYVTLAKYGLIDEDQIAAYGTAHGNLGGHPDVVSVPFIEASTGSLGHGFPGAVGMALGLRIKGMLNRVYCLLGDGECHEGTVWEAANVAANLELGSLVAIVDWNGSAAQLMPIDDLPAKWRAFGWQVHELDGHSTEGLRNCFRDLQLSAQGQPQAIIAHTVKGKGAKLLEGHGQWHHRIPTDEEWLLIKRELQET